MNHWKYRIVYILQWKINVLTLILNIAILILFLKVYQYFFKTALKIWNQIKLQLSKKSDAKTNFRKQKKTIISQNSFNNCIVLPNLIVFYLNWFFKIIEYIFVSPFFPGQDLKFLPALCGHLSFEESVILTPNLFNSTLLIIFKSGKFL